MKPGKGQPLILPRAFVVGDWCKNICSVIYMVHIYVFTYAQIYVHECSIKTWLSTVLT